MNKVTIRVADMVGSSLCISAEDGHKVFEKIKQLFENDQKVIVSFEKVTMLISLFLNASIGQLYGSFSEEVIRERLEVSGLENEDIEMLKKVVDNAKKYYSNPTGYDAAWELDDENKRDEE
jgi:transcriptional regulator